VGLVAGAGAATAIGAVANYARDARVPEPVPAAVAQDAGGLVRRDESFTAIPASAESATSGPATTQPAIVAVTPAAAPQLVAVTPAVVPAVRPVEPAPRPARAAHARVVDVRPVTDAVSEPREVCRDEPVVQQAPVRDEHRVAGTLIGAAIGGLLGNQIGDGDGRRIATVAGAAAGGYAGNRIQDRVQRSNTVTTTERRCETVYETRERARGYDVTYSYEGRTQTVRMDHDPGERLPVRDGRVLTAAR
jgi:uncharacterized protein YcfJ